MSELGRVRRTLVVLGDAALLLAPSYGPAPGRSAPAPLPLKGGRPLPDLAPWAVEVTQAINGALVAPHPYAAGKSLAYHGEPLVAGKKTVVRLYGTTTRSAAACTTTT